MAELTFDVVLASRLKTALIRNEITDLADIDWLTQRNNIARVREIRLGHAEIVPSEHLIDCDLDPHVPDGMLLEKHQKSGLFKWCVANVKLFVETSQEINNFIEGERLRSMLAEQSVLNANVLDYLFNNQVLIPEWWKGKRIYFWGTIYRNQKDFPYVRNLFWDDKTGWRWSFSWIGEGFLGNYVAAIAA